MHDRIKQRWPAKLREKLVGVTAWHPGGIIPRTQRHAKPQGRLSGQIKLLLLVNGLFAVANALSGTFVNVYLWKAKADFTMIAWFAITHQLTMSIVFWLAGKWVKEHNKMNALRLGVAAAAVFYTLVLWLGPEAANQVLLLGFTQGISSGFFWLAFNVAYFEVTGPDTRDKFNGWAGLLGSFAGMIAPWVSGFLITRLSDANGYRLIFSLSLAIFVIGFVVSFFLKKRKVPGRYEWAFGVRKLRERGNPWRTISLAMVAQGMREGVFGFLIGLLVYIATKNEMKLGNFSLITSAVALVAFWAVGKLMKPRFRSTGMLLGVIAMIAIILPLYWRVNYATLLLFGAVTALVMPLYSIPITSAVFDKIGQTKQSARRRVELVVLREVSLNVGRGIGTLLFIAVVSWSTAPPVINTLLLVIGSSPLAAWLLIRPWLKEPAAGARRAG